MILHLARFFGLTVIPPGTDRAIIDGYAVGRADRYRTIGHHDIQVPAGWHVRAPEPPPPLGATFIPTAGHAEPRRVESVDGSVVTYSVPSGVVRVCGVESFNRWAREKRAGAGPCPMVWGGDQTARARPDDAPVSCVREGE